MLLKSVVPPLYLRETEGCFVVIVVCLFSVLGLKLESCFIVDKSYHRATCLDQGKQFIYCSRTYYLQAWQCRTMYVYYLVLRVGVKAYLGVSPVQWPESLT